MANHTVIVFVPWRELSGIHNKSIKKTAKYRKEVKLSQSLTFYRDEYEEISKHYDPKYLLAVMNSTFARNFLNERRSSKLDIYPDDWKQLPIPVASKDEQHAISRLVTKLCESIQSGAKPTEIASFEAKIDAAVNDVIRRTSR